MATSPVSICSNALLMLGAKTIASFDESTDMATLASNLWPDVRDMVLRSHPWNCVTTRVVLAPLAAAPAYEWPYAFQLPSDWLRTLSVGENGEYPEFVMEGKTILFDEATLKLRYIRTSDDVTSWDSLLVAAMTLAMAAAMAYPVTKSAAVKTDMQAQFAAVLQQARSTNGQEDTGETFGDSPLLAARYAGSSSGI